MEGTGPNSQARVVKKMHEEHQKVTHGPRSYRYRLGLQVYEMRAICRDNRISLGTRCEVEIFPRDNWWTRNPDEVLRVCIERYQSGV